MTDSIRFNVSLSADEADEILEALQAINREMDKLPEEEERYYATNHLMAKIAIRRFVSQVSSLSSLSNGDLTPKLSKWIYLASHEQTEWLLGFLQGLTPNTKGWGATDDHNALINICLTRLQQPEFNKEQLQFYMYYYNK